MQPTTAFPSDLIVAAVNGTSDLVFVQSNGLDLFIYDAANSTLLSTSSLLPVTKYGGGIAVFSQP
jgi:hypothetical protein